MERVFVSWNVAGLNPGADERTEAQCFALLLSDPGPTVIALQEVVRRTWYAGFRPHLRAAGYRVFPEDPTETDSEYFSLLASRAPFEAVDWPFAPSRMGRRLLAVRADGFTYATAHLESERAGSMWRVDQARAVVRALAAADGPAVFAGDTNLRNDEEPKIPELADVDDAWVAVGSPAASRVTWSSARASARFDRAWVNRHAAVAGVDLVPGTAACSDHAALRVRLGAVA